MKGPVMKDGDIYFWRWRDGVALSDWPYHCMSQKAVVKDGRLLDTFWHSHSDRSELNPDKVVLEHKGNVADLREIDPHEIPYYDADCVIDMRHSNHSGAPVYVPKGAARSREAMHQHIAETRNKLNSEIQHLRWRLGRLDAAERKVSLGELSDVCV